ncbi:TetR/AcrR family transcriptional regulator [Actinoplanes sp. NPDC051343]|uniref:TetR/AcrR family transcriptional regulator n=1 Tax=Actinoplanes sp. NPDC051343 TaxID=3363906 RepID=UPI00378C9338
MGHREDLLEGAKRCLIEKGFGRTTARDIISASGANLASIGYHYGSKEALLGVAMIEATREWGEKIAAATFKSGEPATQERFEQFWDELMKPLADNRALWSVNFEMLSQIERVETLRAGLTSGLEEARQGLGGVWSGDQESDPATVAAVGAVFQALLTGVMAQWLVDPDSAPSGAVLTQGLRALVEVLSRRPAAAQPAGVE